MTLRERRRRTTELNSRWRSTRELLAAALQAMEYDRALVYHIEMDDLEGEIVVLSQRSGHDPYRACRPGERPITAADSLALRMNP
jgi:hypothetical protein